MLGHGPSRLYVRYCCCILTGQTWHRHEHVSSHSFSQAWKLPSPLWWLAFRSCVRYSRDGPAPGMIAVGKTDVGETAAAATEERASLSCCFPQRGLTDAITVRMPSRKSSKQSKWRVYSLVRKVEVTMRHLYRNTDDGAHDKSTASHACAVVFARI